MKNLKSFQVLSSILVKNYPMHASSVQDLLSPAISIQVSDVKGYDGAHPKSKFGGIPMLPKHFDWPKCNGVDLYFFCMINLKDLEGLQVFPSPPRNGMLYFFMLIEGLNRYPENPEEFLVFFEEGNNPSDLIPHKSDSMVFDEVFLDFKGIYTVPSYQSYLLRYESDELNNALEEIQYDMDELQDMESDYFNQLFGHPKSIQNDVAYDWAFKKLGYSSHDLNDIQKNAMLEMESNYLNLLQIDFANSGTNFSDYGGDGVAYFGMDKEDFMKNDFSKCSLLVQST